MGKTTISWTEDTWNPLRGCSRFSPGCEHCYAEQIAMRFSGPGLAFDGYATKGKGWTRKVSLLPDVLAEPLSWKKPRLAFVSMSDPFHEKLTNEEIAALFGVMAAARSSTFQILTKRSERMAEWFRWVSVQTLGDETMRPTAVCQLHANRFLPVTHVDEYNRLMWLRHPFEWPLPNLWLGTSIESQAYAVRALDLMDCPAVVRFISAEPLIGPLDLVNVRDHRSYPNRYVNALMGCSATARGRNKKVKPDRIHWVIAGVESGNGARPCKVEWLRSLRDQCWPLTKFFLKQANGDMTDECAGKGATFAELHPIGIGKGSRQKRGRLLELPYLDGVQWDQMPEVATDAA